MILEIQRLKQVSSETLDKTEFKQPSMNPYDYLPMREVQNYQNYREVQNYQNYRDVQNYQNINSNAQTYQNFNQMHMRKLPDCQNRVPDYQNRVPEYQNFRVPDYQNLRVPNYESVDYVAMKSIQDQHNGCDGNYSDDDCKENEFSVDEGIYLLPSNLITSTPLQLLCNGYQVNTSYFCLIFY